MEIWGFCADARFVRDATLSFEPAVLSERLATRFNADAITTPLLRFSNDRIWTELSPIFGDGRAGQAAAVSG
jgi:hypothetical protein